MPKISVIVPVYNAEKYLHRCIDSILAQTFTDFELLLIDDGSKDGSGKICDEYAANDVRVRVFHKPNGGVSSARNLGLDNATGEWIAFIDSDDYVNICYLQNLYSQNSFDLVLSNFEYFGNELYTNEYELQKCILTTFESIILHIKSFSPFYEFVYSKLFKMNILYKYHIRFDENLRAGEDMTFVYDYVKYVNNISILPMKDYYYDVSVPKSLSKQYSLYSDEYFLKTVYSSIWKLAPDGSLKDVYVKGRAQYFKYKIKEIFARNQKIKCEKNELKHFISKEFILPFIHDSKVMDKGFRGKLFDFLAQNRQWLLLAFYARYFNNKGY